MSFNFKPLWKKLIDEEMTKEDLRKILNLSPSTVAKMSKIENQDAWVSLEVLHRICKYFNCQPNEIIEYIDEMVHTHEIIEYISDNDDEFVHTHTIKGKTVKKKTARKEMDEETDKEETVNNDDYYTPDICGQCASCLVNDCKGQTGTFKKELCPDENEG